jgi:amino acid adenylation domain-containing protein/non-ribosomal peptide synthase protein (TIGR01720 family)
MVKLDKDNVVDILPLSFVQEGILFHHLDNSESGEYLQQTVISVVGVLDKINFEKAYEDVIQVHEGLRIIFCWEGLKSPIQVILKKPILDLRFFEEHETIDEVLNKDAAEGIDIEKNPFRLLVVSQSELEHTLIFSFHHIVLDGWSFSILLNEFFTKYANLNSGGNLERQTNTDGTIKNYLEWIQQKNNESAEIFWKNNLETFTAHTSLPFQSVQKVNGNRKKSFPISQNLITDIENCAKRNKVSVASVIYASWALFLHVSTGEETITFGTTTSGRPNEIPNITKTVGLFINTLPFHSIIDNEQNVSSFIKSISTTAIDIGEQEFSSISNIKKYAGINTTATLFNSLCVIENYPLELDETQNGFKVVSSEVYENTNYDISCSFLPFDLENALLFSYKNRSFTEQSINKIAELLTLTIEYITQAKVNASIKDLNLISATDQLRILGEFNDTEFTFENLMTVHKSLETQAKLFPDKVALICNDEQLSYKNLNDASTTLASQLINKGIGEDVVVGVCMERSFELLISIFAIFKAGGIYLPIDTSFPQHRVEYILNDSNAKHIIQIKKTDQRIPIFSDDCVSNIDYKELLNESYSSSTKLIDNLNYNAYIIYTSGSTGNPKGVLVNHASLVNGITWVQNKCPLNSEDVLMLKTPIVFDVSLWELFWWVIGGASLCILPPNGEREIDTLTTHIINYKVTKLFFVPTLLRLFTTYVNELQMTEQFSHVSHVFSSGEALKPNDAFEFYKTFDTNNSKLLNLYGPTEATVHVSYFECLDEGKLSEIIPIGKPVVNTQLYILNDQLQLQPIGLEGELYIAGDCLAKGYLNRPQLTDEKFLDNPFGAGKIYKSGDVAKWDEDGNVLYVGRKDNQVKIKGFRIELGEIENCLNQYSGIQDAKVVVRKDTYDEFILEAFCVGSEKLKSNKIIKFIEGKLPGYMIPTHLHLIEEIPLTHNGKIDKEKLLSLRKVKTGQQQVVTNNVDNTILRLLIEICREVLSLNDVKPTDNFFKIGGDSIKAIRVLSLLRKNGYNITMKEIFDSPILQELSLRVKDIHPHKNYKRFEGEAPLNAIQTNFFLVDNEHVNRYNQAIVLDFTTAFPKDRMNEILQCVVEHHDVFRMKFRNNGKAMEAYYSKESPSVDTFYTSSTIENTVTNYLEESINEMHAGLNITEGTMARFKLLVSPNSARLVIVMHHLIVDGVSWRILIEDIETLMRQKIAGEQVQLSARSNSFGGYMISLKDKIQELYFSSEISYWQHLNEKSSPQLFASDKKQFTYADLQRKSVTLRKNSIQKIENINDKLGTNTNEVLLAALGLSLKSQYNLQGVMINMEGHGRTEFDSSIDLSKTIGWFTSLYPVYVEMHESEGLLAYTRLLKETVRSVPNNGEGFGILKHLQTIDFNTHAPEISFNYLGDFSSFSETEFFKVSMEQIGSWYAPERTIQHALEVFAILDKSNDLVIMADFVSELINENDATAILNSMHQYISEIEKVCIASQTFLKTPSDFTFKQFDIATLDQVHNKMGEIKDIYELSPTQEGLLYQCQSSEDSYDYIVSSTVRMTGSLDYKILSQSYSILVDRHDTLRTVFNDQLNSEQTLQLVMQNHNAAIDYTNLIGCDDATIDARLNKLNKEGRVAVRTILSDETNIRLSLMKTREKEFRLVFYHHHIILDGWSIVVLFNELFRIYNLLLQNKDPKLEMEPAPSYNYYIKWLRTSNSIEPSEYWNNYLMNFKEPFEFSRKQLSTQHKEHGFIGVVIEEADVQQLQTLAINLNATLYNCIQAAWALLLSKISGNNDLVYGHVVSGRPEIAMADQMTGLFINTIPKRVRLETGMNFRDLIKSVAKDEMATIPYHHYSLADILTKSTHRSKTFSHIVTFENQYQLMESMKKNNTGDLVITKLEGDDPNHYDMNVFFYEVEKTLKVEFRYNAHLYDRDYLTQIMNDFKSLLSHTIQNPNKKLEEILLDVTGEMDLPVLSI